MTSRDYSFEFSLPEWLAPILPDPEQAIIDLTQRMDLVLDLVEANIRHDGGPFAAGVFDAEGRLVAPGINRVVDDGCSVLHAEMVALMLAQRRLGRHDLSDGGKYRYELVTSTEPCAMCLGALPWSGVRRLVCGARDEDARAVGFDEGDKPGHWFEGLQRRGIDVRRDVARERAVALLQLYVESGGVVYNGGDN